MMAQRSKRMLAAGLLSVALMGGSVACGGDDGGVEPRDGNPGNEQQEDGGLY